MSQNRFAQLANNYYRYYDYTSNISIYYYIYRSIYQNYVESGVCNFCDINTFDICTYKKEESIDEFIISNVINRDLKLYPISILEMVELSIKSRSTMQQVLLMFMANLLDIDNDVHKVNNALSNKCRELCKFEEINIILVDSLSFILISPIINIIFSYIKIEIPQFKSIY